MTAEERIELAKLLRSAVGGSITQEDFWQKLDSFRSSIRDRLFDLIYEEGHHFWGVFNQRNLLFMRVSPEASSVEYGRQMFLTLAECLENNCSAEEAEQRINSL